MMPADIAPLCATPEMLPLVDAAFERSVKGNAAARELALVCRRCPAAGACIKEAASRREHGTWASTRRRTKPGGGLGAIKVVA